MTNEDWRERQLKNLSDLVVGILVLGAIAALGFIVLTQCSPAWRAICP